MKNKFSSHSQCQKKKETGKGKAKETNATERFEIGKQKFSSMKITLSKFQSILEESSDIDNSESDSDIDSEVSESDDEIQHDVSAGDVQIGHENYGVASAVPSDTHASQTLPTGTTAWCTNNTPPVVEDFTGTPGMTVPIKDTPVGFLQLFVT